MATLAVALLVVTSVVVYPVGYAGTDASSDIEIENQPTPTPTPESPQGPSIQSEGGYFDPTDHDPEEDGIIDPKIHESDEDILVVIVTVDSNEDGSHVEEVIDDSSGMELKNHIGISNSYIVEIDRRDADVEDLVVEHVKSIEFNHVVEIDSVSTHSAQNVERGLDWINAPEVWDEYDTKGEGIDVAVIDTGVDPDHPDLDVSSYVYFDEDGVMVTDDFSQAEDASDHGTHVSGTVAGGNASGSYIGVAPEANIHAVRVFENGDSTTRIAILAGMDWAVENDMDIMSISLGGFASTPADSYVQAVREAERHGILTVAASGNYGLYYEYNQGVWTSEPANVYGVLDVGAVTGGELREHDAHKNMSGSGTEEDPYIVTDIQELQSIHSTAHEGYHYKLGNDIDASETQDWDGGFKPIGTFSGTFDGDGHEIRDLYISREDQEKVGLFSELEDAEVKNLRLLDIEIIGGREIGGVAGVVKRGETYIENVYVSGDIEARSDETEVHSGLLVGVVAGGYAYNNDNEIKRVAVKGTAVSANSNRWFGGVVGYNSGGKISESVAYDVTVQGGSYHAAFAGDNTGGGTIVDSVAHGYVPVGGGFTTDSGNIENSFSTVEVGQSPTGASVDNTGLATSDSGDVNDTYWDIESSTMPDSPVGIGLTTDEMTGEDAPDNMNLNFTDTWETTDEYPKLQWFDESNFDATADEQPDLGEIEYETRRIVTWFSAYESYVSATPPSDAPHWQHGTSVPKVVADGSGVTSTVPGGGYSSFSGTSMSTPHVSGSAALIMSTHPDLRPHAIIRLFEDTADPVDDYESGDSISAGEGHANVLAAMEKAEEVGYVEGEIIYTNMTETGEITVLAEYGEREVVSGGQFNVSAQTGDRELWINGPEYYEGVYQNDQQIVTVDIQESQTQTGVEFHVEPIIEFGGEDAIGVAYDGGKGDVQTVNQGYAGELTPQVMEGSDINASNVTYIIEGVEIESGETYSFDEKRITEIEIEVLVDGETGTLQTEYSASNFDATKTTTETTEISKTYGLIHADESIPFDEILVGDEEYEPGTAEVHRIESIGLDAINVPGSEGAEFRIVSSEHEPVTFEFSSSSFEEVVFYDKRDTYLSEMGRSAESDEVEFSTNQVYWIQPDPSDTFDPMTINLNSTGDISDVWISDRKVDHGESSGDVTLNQNMDIDFVSIEFASDGGEPGNVTISAGEQNVSDVKTVYVDGFPYFYWEVSDDNETETQDTSGGEELTVYGVESGSKVTFSTEEEIGEGGIVPSERDSDDIVDDVEDTIDDISDTVNGVVEATEDRLPAVPAPVAVGGAIGIAVGIGRWRGVV